MTLMDRFSLTGRKALVTGAGKGIGRAIAIGFAEAGADIALLARTQSDIDSAAAEIEALGRKAVPIRFDVMDLDEIPKVVAGASEELGGLNVIVNNAGGSMPRALLETSKTSFEKSFSFNVTTAFEFTKAGVPEMLASGGGAVVNISSGAGVMPDRGFAAYGTAKAALSYLSREMALDLAPHIRVNAIAVGAVATAALETVLTNDELRTAMEESTPLRRVGEVDDIAAAALYLASDASSFVSGRVLQVDGGVTNSTLDLGLPDYEPPSA